MTESLSVVMQRYANKKAQIKRLKTLLEEHRTEILTILKVNDLTEYEDDNHTLILTSNKRRSFNKEEAIDALKEHGEDTDKFFTESDFETLLVKSKQRDINE